MTKIPLRRKKEQKLFAYSPTTVVQLLKFLKHQPSIPQTTWNKVTTHQPIDQMQVQPKLDKMGMNLFAESKQEKRKTSLANDNLVLLDVHLCIKTCLWDWNGKSALF